MRAVEKKSDNPACCLRVLMTSSWLNGSLLRRFRTGDSLKPSLN